MARRATRTHGREQRPHAVQAEAARGTPYKDARSVGQEALRQAVLRSARELLAAEGPDALTMRRIADALGSSTTVLYSNFAGKNAIIDAIVVAGHQELRERLGTIAAEQEPFARLAESARVYRRFALDDPARYRLLFGADLRGYERGTSAREAAQASFGALADLVRDCQSAGILRADADPDFVSEILIAAAHGAVSLELSGHFDDPLRADQRFAVLTAASAAPFLAGDAAS
jgi:AcrR family transcriptional regulator